MVCRPGGVVRPGRGRRLRPRPPLCRGRRTPVAAVCRGRHRRGLGPGCGVGGDGPQVRACHEGPPGRTRGRGGGPGHPGLGGVPVTGPLPPEARTREENTARAAAVVEALVECGVGLLVVAPGSRSTPLVLAAAREPRLATVVQVDERSAAFFALGAGKASGVPAAVLTTSGTAVANLVPAAVEADRSEAPLVLLTADRPPRLRDADANQVVDQLGILGGVVRHQVELAAASGGAPVELDWVKRAVGDAVRAALGDPAGAVHLNVPFDKPLEPGASPDDAATLPRTDGAGPGSGPGSGPGKAELPRLLRRRAAPAPEELDWLAVALARARRPLLVGGRLPHPREAGPALLALARTLGSAASPAPLLADPLSGARTGADAGGLGGYDLLLSDAGLVEALAPDLVVRFGASPTSSRLLRAQEAWVRGGASLVVVDGGERSKDHQALAARCLRADPALAADALSGRIAGARREAKREGGDTGEPPPTRWTETWHRADRAARQAALEVARERGGEPGLVAALADALDEEDLLFVSSSMPIRDVDTFFAPPTPPRILANRGASGIDGIVSTALGAARATGRPLTLLVGDLALLHDSNGLLALSEVPGPVRIVVANNDGGGIFGMLPVSSHEPPFTRFFITPHGRDFSHLAALHGLDFVRTDLREAGDPGEPAGVLEATGRKRTEGPGGGSAGHRALLAEFLTDAPRDMETRQLARTAAVRAARAELPQHSPHHLTTEQEGDA
ncbi:MAG: 2-succinyl-5-enolpyruvyl-6-hydroxy-3-cyclohexene-1-carboxylic-acid synthase [Gemmatimonadales bacterium]|nr:MAG: 2-succinyl-5-enolpyruvyl-6-hydroxy-3-cyclohexene-1-carboxylic-acid synthase [Gemmatimonadales bacterium]